MYQPPRDDARVRLGDAAWEKAFAEGKAMSIEETFEYAICDEGTKIPAQEPPSSGGQPPVLTRRQEEVAAFVARGLTNRQVHISEHTAATHVRRILKKLGLQSRSQIGSWLAEQRP